jgi:uncharacterized protein (DUF885 family)
MTLRRAALCLALALPPTAARADDAEDAKLRDFFKAYLDADLRAHPTAATRLGDHRFDHLLDELGAAARARNAARDRQALADLPTAVNRARLSRSAQVDFDILKHHLTYLVWFSENTRPHRDDPLMYNELISDSVYLLLTQSSAPKAANVKNAVARIEQVPRVIEAAKADIKAPPKVYAETAVRRNQGAIAFYKHGIFELAAGTPHDDALKAACAKAVTALEGYQGWLEKTLLPRADGDWRIGKERFANKLELELGAGLTSEQVLAEAEREMDRVERDLYVLSRQLWATTFPGKPLPPDDAAGRRQTIALVLHRLAQEHGKAEDLLKDARATVAAIKAFIKDNDIVRLPDPDRCLIVEMPEFQRGFSVAYLNQAPALDPQAASVYAVSPPPRDWDARRVNTYLEEYNRYMLQILTIHEAYPGHYVQLEYSNRHPSLLRRVLSSGVFAEGWAVYTEQMMLDQGYGKGDPALRLHQLKFYLRTVANAYLDNKMHTANMSDEEALKFLTERAFQSEGEAVGKIVRAKLSSCQLSTYFVGRTAFYRLRQEVQRELGDAFELGRFHEAVLDHGTLPVKYLPELVRERLKKPR